MYVCFVLEIFVPKYIIIFRQTLEFSTIVLLPRASHPDTQMTEVISLRSNRAKDCPGKSNSFPQKFAKILTFTGVIYDFIQSISEYADAIWRVLTWFGYESTGQNMNLAWYDNSYLTKISVFLTSRLVFNSKIDPLSSFSRNQKHPTRRTDGRGH